MVAEKATPGAWCWAGQAVDVLVDLHRLATDARAAGEGTVDPDDTAEPLRRFRHAVQIGISQTAPRATKPMRTENALARRLADRETDYTTAASGNVHPLWRCQTCWSQACPAMAGQANLGRSGTTYAS